MSSSYQSGRWVVMVGIWLLVILSLYPPTKLWAHTELVAADPAPGASLTTTPPEIRLSFGEPNDPWSRILLFGPGFRSIPGVITHVNPDAPEQLVATLPPLAPDTYTVQWVAVAIDKHVTRGSYTFGVKQPGNEYLWLSIAATLAIWALLLASNPWRKKPRQVR